MNASSLFETLATHVSQSTLFAAAAVLLAIALGRRRVGVCYGLWLAASLKFLFPFAWLESLGSRASWHSAPLMALKEVVSSADELAAPLSAPALTATEGGVSIAAILLALWAAGCLFAIVRQYRRCCHVARIVRAARLIQQGREWDALQRVQTSVAVTQRIRLFVSRAAIEPGVFGVVRPVLLLPAGIAAALTDPQLDAILAHELCHVRRRDNLAAAAHMVVETLFWFHPLVWWLGAQLVYARERACDEAVLRLGNESRAYAESILRACRFSLESPVECYSRVTGGDLQARIERIMRREFAARLGAGAKALLTCGAAAAISLPVLAGLARIPVARAQTRAGSETFEVVSIKPAAPGMRGNGFITDPGRMRMMNVTLSQIILEAYAVQPFQLVAKDLPAERFEVLASAPTHSSRVLDQRYQGMMQALLADRFHLQVHRDKKVMAVYALGLATGGGKMSESSEPGLSTRSTPGHMTATGASLLDIAAYLTRRLGRPVVDVTGLTKLYDFKLDWTPDGGELTSEPPDPDRPKLDEPSGSPSLYTALREQLGLKLETKKLPVEMLVVDHWEKPAEN